MCQGARDETLAEEIRAKQAAQLPADLRPVDDEVDPNDPNSRFRTEAGDAQGRSGYPEIGGWAWNNL